MAETPKKDSGLDQVLGELNQNIRKDTPAASGGPDEKSAAKGNAPRQNTGKGGNSRPNQPKQNPQKQNQQKQNPQKQNQQKQSQQKQGGQKPNNNSQSRKKPNQRQQPNQKKKPAIELPDLAETLEEGLRVFEETDRIVEENSETAEEIRREEHAGQNDVHREKHIEVVSVEEIDEPAPPKKGSGTPPPEKKKEAVPPAPEDSAEAEMNAPVPHPHRKKRKKMGKREFRTAILGIVMTFFVIVGVISTIVTIVNVSVGLATSSAQKDEFARYIFPLVIIDTPEFESPDLLDNSQIISSAIWAFIIDEDNDKSKYPHDDLGGMTVPDADIEPYIRRLFGSNIKIKHQTVDGASFQMLYDEATKSYIIESTPRFLPYTPRVEEIAREGDIFTLRVGYVQPDVVWNLDPENRNQSVDKVMQYTLKQNGDNYEIRSVKLLEVTGVETTPSEPTSSVYGEISSEEEQIVSDLPSQPGEDTSELTASMTASDAAVPEE